MINHEQMFEWKDNGNGEGIELLYKPKLDYVLITVGKKEFRIAKDDIWALAFSIAGEEQQADLIPVKTQETRVFNKRVKLKAKKAIPVGGTMMADIKFTVPLELLVKEHNKILIPN